MRQDPDVILVGEIRDLETADIAMQSALTGHLVLSTLHTNDAVGAVPRLINLGVKAGLDRAGLGARDCATIGSCALPGLQKRSPTR